MRTGALLVSLGSGCLLASYTGNINYFSPSAHHPGLGVSIRKVAARHYANSPWDPATLNFTHGVASGDPYQDSVILWTRAAPIGSDNDDSNVTVSGLVALYSHETEKYVKASAAPVCLQWSISESKDLASPADSGTAYTSSDIDYTVKVEAKNLKPFTIYWYQFNMCNSQVKSPLGRTKTLPAKGSRDVTSVKLAVYSCSNYPAGFFNAYGNAVNKDSVDYVVHLGDYIYEYEDGHYGWGHSMGRIPLPNEEIVSLYDYRKRHATHRTDAGLYRSHQSFPWIPTWDDHEVADNVWKAGSAGMNNSEDSFVREGGVSTDQRKMNAVRAYFEWMPIRQVDMDDNLRVWRSFAFGDLLDLIVLDTRVYDRSITDLYWNSPYVDAIRAEASRSLMGPRQES
ncbi:alkaline phosphatase D, partial [Magnaporthiopsis poae ATCC 64411]